MFLILTLFITIHLLFHQFLIQFITVLEFMEEVMFIQALDTQQLHLLSHQLAPMDHIGLELFAYHLFNHILLNAPQDTQILMEIVSTKVVHLHLISHVDQVLGMVLLVLINKTQTQHAVLENIGMVMFV